MGEIPVLSQVPPGSSCFSGALEEAGLTCPTVSWLPGALLTLWRDVALSEAGHPPPQPPTAVGWSPDSQRGGHGLCGLFNMGGFVCVAREKTPDWGFGGVGSASCTSWEGGKMASSKLGDPG